MALVFVLNLFLLLVMASFLYCFPHLSLFKLLQYLSKAIAKSKRKGLIKSWKSDKARIRQRTDIIIQAKKIKSDNFTMSKREKSNIDFTILKNYHIYSIQIILHLEASMLFSSSSVQPAKCKYCIKWAI